MKKTKFIIAFVIFFNVIGFVYGQKRATLFIDSTEVMFTDVSFPYWLKAGQSISLGVNVQKVSIIEFNINSTALEFSKVISLTSNQIVPTNKAWKIESVGLNMLDTNTSIGMILNNFNSSSTSSNLPTIYKSPIKYEVPGTYYWKVPPGITSVCIEVWGGGGGGPGVNLVYQHAAGGGGGGYGYGCYSVTPGTTYTVVVGGGGSAPSPPVGPATNGGTSSFGNLIYATGGSAGAGPTNSTNCSGAIGGSGGTSNGQYKIDGQAGGNSNPCTSFSGNGGNAGNGGDGGASIYAQGTGNSGNLPGGGGSGSINSSSATLRLGGAGARGQVYIYF